MSYLEAVTASLFSKVTWIFTKHICKQIWKEFCDTFENGNLLKHLLIAAPWLFWILISSTYPHYLANSASESQKSSSKIGQSVTWLGVWWKATTTVYMMGAFTKSWSNANTHILVEFIGQFWDCWYHNTPYYATNKSDIRTSLLITRAHKKMIKTLLRSAMDLVLTWKEKTSSETLNN